MKHSAETETSEAGDCSLEVVALTDLEATVDEKIAVLVNRMTVMSRGRGRDDSDPYQISRDFLNEQRRLRLENNRN